MLLATLVSRDKHGNTTHILRDVRCTPEELGDLIGCQQNNSKTVDVSVSVRFDDKKRYRPINDLSNMAV